MFKGSPEASLRRSILQPAASARSVLHFANDCWTCPAECAKLGAPVFLSLTPYFRTPRMILLLMGVTGSGKSTIGKLLAERLAWVFLEADQFHSPENIAKMRNGIPLTDADRLPWLDAIHSRLVALYAEGKDIVLACSALKESYRQRLAKNLAVEIVYLKGSPVLIGRRLRESPGHFAGTAILPGQFADVEEPGEALTLPVELPPEDIV